MRRRECLMAAGVALFAGSCSKPQAPARYRVKFETTKGDFIVDVVRAWAPLGADRFHELVTKGFYDGCRFFRIVPGFVVQWGLKGDPALDAHWDAEVFDDDPPGHMSNMPATISFATKGPNSRGSQVFINLGSNQRLDSMGFTPFGRVGEGMSVVANLNGEYGEGPDQMKLKQQGLKYLETEFPRLDYIKKAAILPAE